MSATSAAALVAALLACTACGGAAFTVASDDVANDAGELAESSTLPEAAAPSPEAGSSGDAGGGNDRDARAPIEASPNDAGKPTADSGSPELDSGVDAEASVPPIEAGRGDTGVATDPVTYACGTKPGDVPPQNLPPNPALLQWWVSLSVQQIDGGEAEDYCDIMSLGQGVDGGSINPFPYTCEGIAAVWDCYHWQGQGGNLGCHPNAINPAVLQVDCWAP